MSNEGDVHKDRFVECMFLESFAPFGKILVKPYTARYNPQKCLVVWFQAAALRA
jgi:hypothetical protein